MNQLESTINDVMDELAEHSDVLFALADKPHEPDALRAIAYDLRRLRDELGDARIRPNANSAR